MKGLRHFARELFTHDFLKGKFIYEEGGPEHRPPATGEFKKMDKPLTLGKGPEAVETGEKKETPLPGTEKAAEERVDEQDAAARKRAELAANKAKALLAKLFPKSGGGATKELLASASTTEELNAAFEGASAQPPSTETASLKLRGATDTGRVATLGPIGTSLGTEAPPPAPPKVARRKPRGKEGKKA
jgi:hypothetical protein